MEEINREELILSLLQDNLINLKLVYGLESLGLVPDDYFLNLGHTVFKLMGFESSEQSDLIFERVLMASSEKVKQLEISESRVEFRELSKEIYQELVFAKHISDSSPDSDKN